MKFLTRSCAVYVMCALFFLGIFQLKAQAEECCPEIPCSLEPLPPLCLKPQPHQFYIGSDIYHVHRNREGGTNQKGWLYGARIGYDYIKRYAIYFGCEAAYATGKLHGKSATSTLRSNLTDAHVEGRVGYTLQQKAGWQTSFTPFIGLGYFEEINKFVHPTPIHVHFETRFCYYDLGFLSKISPLPCLDIGINFKAKLMINAENRVTHDPQFDDSKMMIKHEIQYRVDLPFTYKWDKRILFCLSPFYEYRHYGRQENFPFDFLETTFQIYGVTIKLIYNF